MKLLLDVYKRQLFEVERNRYIRLFHNSIFYVAKLLDIELFTVMKIIAEQRKMCIRDRCD